jgi:cytosine/adenosine deaminase-related metal-dependent hydrolase
VLEDGALIVAGGRIARVGPWSKLKALVGPGDPAEHFADAAILPGLVNAHTHLGLTDLEGHFRPTADFAGWLGRLIAHRITRTQPAIRRAVRQGADQARAAGTVAGADVTPEPFCDNVLTPNDARWIVFGEALRFGPKAVDRLQQTVEDMQRLRRMTSVAVGLSPHAPYSTGLAVFKAARQVADANGWPVTTHLHETLDEIAFTERGDGPLYDLVRGFGLLPRAWMPAGVRPIRMLADAGFFAKPVLVAHGNYLNDDDIAVLAKSGSSVVCCPRSHAFFQHRDHPWRRLLAKGVNVCLGTDSLASSPSLSVLDEARFLFANESKADPRLILDMATRRGARALGLEGVTGDLRPELAAAFCVVSPVGKTRDPAAAVLAAGAKDIRLICP